MARIAVIGGGFGGIFALLHLESHTRNDELLLFDPRSRFVFTPLLHEVAGGVLDKKATTVAYEELLARTRHIRHAVTHLDLRKKELIAGKKYSFDYIIISPGATTNFYGKEYPGALEIKTFDDAINIRWTIERNVQQAAKMLQKYPGSDVSKLLHVVVVGGGATGVEVAGECIGLLRFRCKMDEISRKPKITLVHAKKRLLHQLDDYFHRTAYNRLKKKGVEVLLNANVTKTTRESVELVVTKKEEKNSEKMTIATSCIIWAAGIAPNNIHSPHTAAPYLVEKTLQLERYPHAYAVGDAMRIKDTQLPALAQVASKQGTHAARNIIRSMRGKELLHFKYKNRGMLVSVGQKYAVGRIMGIPVKGFPAWFIMRTVYLFKFKNIKQEIRTAAEYTVRLFIREKNCVKIRKAGKNGSDI